MRHHEILKQLLTEAKNNADVVGFLVFGSVATGTQQENSDLDVITVLRKFAPGSAIRNTYVDGIKVGDIVFDYDVFVHGVENVPYLLHPVGEAKILFDREGKIKTLLEKIQEYFANHPEIVDQWNEYYNRFNQEKAQFGYEKTSIVEVWDELENLFSIGKDRRRFFIE